jgi:hypothetical protein
MRARRAIFHRNQALAQPDTRAGLDRIDNAYLVAAVIDGPRGPGKLVDASAKLGQQRQQQLAMRDGLAAGHFAFGAFHINMDPLMIAGDFREAINQILRDFQPITDPQFLPDQRAERFRRFDHAHCDPPLIT